MSRESSFSENGLHFVRTHVTIKTKAAPRNQVSHTDFRNRHRLFSYMLREKGHDITITNAPLNHLKAEHSSG